MGYTPKEFSKTLNGQFTGDATPYRCTETGINSWMVGVRSEKMQVQIDISEAPARKIAMLSLPVLNVELIFLQSTLFLENQFMHDFFKYFHKGGG